MISFGPADILGAWALDALLGDPPWIPWPHPVVVMGRAVTALEPRLRRTGASGSRLLFGGGVLWLTVVGGAFLASYALWQGLGWIHPALGRAAGVYLAFACLATRSLDREARRVGRLLRQGRLGRARARLGCIVGRDTERLAPDQVARAAVETVAENASDGVIAPMIYLALGAHLGLGPCLAVAYKAVNTLDSMVGYRDERYEHFGRLPARLDDAANWVPARLTALLAALGAQVLWRRGGASIRTALRDGSLHKSPNAGYPEAAFAGALRVQLGGPSTYRGRVRNAPRLGDPGEPIRAQHVDRSLRLLWATSVLGLLLGVILA